MKLEQAGASGSVKGRTAVGLLRRLHSEKPLLPGTVVVESTSGNLGLALAGLLATLGCTFISVVDLKTPAQTRKSLRLLGAEVLVVEEDDGHGGYLLNRLSVVRRLCAENPDYRWPNQYENSAGPAIHRETTGPEIVEQAGAALRAVYAPVSTGGTLAGVAGHLAEHRPDVDAVAVDLLGSIALGGTAGTRLLPGIGSSRPSVLLPPGSYHRSVLVDDVESIAICRIVSDDLGLRLGSSSGCTLRALVADLAAGRVSGLPVCLMADGGDKYGDTVYSDRWIADQGVGERLAAAVKGFRHEGLSFAWPEDRT
jgi:cysteine synthase A